MPLPGLRSRSLVAAATGARHRRVNFGGVGQELRPPKTPLSDRAQPIHFVLHSPEIPVAGFVSKISHPEWTAENLQPRGGRNLVSAAGGRAPAWRQTARAGREEADR